MDREFNAKRSETMTRRLQMCWSVLLILGASAQADTVYFKDGSKLDGVATRPNDNCVAIRVGSATMSFPASQVVNIESNDNEGTYTLDQIRAKHHNDVMLERTGLNREQRDQARKVVVGLDSDDPKVRRAAREKLKAMGEQMPMFKYLGSCLPYMRGPRVPEMMQVMCELDPKQAQNMLMVRSQDITPLNRAKALELIGATMKEKGTERVAQGLVDHEPAIQISAARTLGDVGDKRASLALTKGLESNDERVRNACKSALTRLWSSENTKVEFQSTADWKNYVNQQASRMGDAIDPARLQPLIVPDPEEGIREYVDE
jgi:HEAT repeats